MNLNNFEKEKITQRLKKLLKLINKHNYLYHTEDNPKITDSEYDKLVKENLDLESKYPSLKLKESISNKVGNVIKNNFCHNCRRRKNTNCI